MLTALVAIAISRPLVLVHYMPWYESKPVSGHWGWHWTMNHFNPDRRHELASRYTPQIGAYDSSDPDVLEYQTLEMKIAGVDGVLIDWYGAKNLNDYGVVHRNSGKIIGACERAGLKFAMVMEDAIVPGLVKAKVSTADDYAKDSIQALRDTWFREAGYLKWKSQPVLLMFGPQYYPEPDLSKWFGGDLAFVSLLSKKGPAVGAFGWPAPQVGDSKSWENLRDFAEKSKAWDVRIPVAYPRFEDIYKAAGVGPGYGEIQDHDGKTMRDSLAIADASKPTFIQIATWNDWGEGTQVEPSVEFGDRDLLVLQKHRREADPGFKYRASDLALPLQLFKLRKARASKTILDHVSREILSGHMVQAASELRLPALRRHSSS